jgi:hypothetical protein
VIIEEKKKILEYLDKWPYNTKNNEISDEIF